MSTNPPTPLRVCVWPEHESTLVEAAQAAGAIIVLPGEAEVLISFNGSVDRMRSVLHRGIRVVQLGSVGIEKWHKAGLIDDRRQWASARGLYSVPMAEHTLALMLCAACDLPRRMHAKTWAPHEWGDPGGRRLMGRTVGIVGCGDVGTALINLLRPFGVRVLALTRSGRKIPEAAESLGPSRLSQLLAASDYIVVAAPSTPETHGLIGASEFCTTQPTAWLINISRGALVDTTALITALKDGQLAGAALDVVEPEPLPDGHPLWNMPNVVITPHVACPRDLCIQLFATRVGENLRRYQAGEALLGIADPTRDY